VTGVTLKDCDFANVAGPSIVKNAGGMRFENVRINGKIARA